MEYHEVLQLVRQEVMRREENQRDSRKCPRCGINTTMLKLYVESPDGEFAVGTEKWRCLNCLSLFTEELREEV